MHIWEGVRLALGQIWAQKLKSFFALLGVIIGVMFLITVVSVVEGMDRYVREDFASEVYGINTVTIRRWPRIAVSSDREDWRRWTRRPRLTYEDATVIRGNLQVPARVAVESVGTGEVAAEGGPKVENVLITGASSEIFQIRDLAIARGRAFSPQEDERGVAVVVLGSSVAETLFPEADPLGKRVRIRGFPFRVIGVLEEQGSLLGQSLDNRAVSPARSPVQSFTAPRGRVDRIVVQTVDPDRLRDAVWELEAIMRARHRLRPSEENSFELETADESLSFWDRISRILFLALPGLVAISLVVGGIVIMNIMLVSVMERTREIGVRKALGAKRRDIMTQVVIESATLSGVGALAGVGIGVGLTWAVRTASPLPAAVAAHWVILGIALGVGVGVAAGVYPAARASKLDPVDALRYE